jgi:hypothetical protein
MSFYLSLCGLTLQCSHITQNIGGDGIQSTSKVEVKLSAGLSTWLATSVQLSISHI